jgi:tryptophanyl-tRNA synthetase
MARIFSGIQPSGELHVGNYLGAVRNWVALQHEMESIFCIVDYHAITVDYDPALLRTRRREMAVGLLAAGIDPERATLFVQSHVPEHTELAWIFNTITPLGELERQVQFKDKAARQESVNAGLLNYPVLQAADILMVRGEVVPVGKDQMSHIELTREIARRFNLLYRPVLPEPEYVVARFPVLPGTDGKPKMSKSIGNTIMLSDDTEMVRQKVMAMYTDPTRLRATDPGHVKGNPVFVYHDAFNRNHDEVADLKARYTRGTVGDVEVKKKLIVALNDFLDPIRERRAQYERQPSLLEDIIADGSQRARAEARQTLDLAREAMGLNYFPRARHHVSNASPVTAGDGSGVANAGSSSGADAGARRAD